jgi:hypothetical protein
MKLRHAVAVALVGQAPGLGGYWDRMGNSVSRTGGLTDTFKPKRDTRAEVIDGTC